MDYKKYFTVVQISERWGISERRVRKLCQNKRVKGVRKEGGMYFIPRQAEKPVDFREYRGLDADRKKGELFRNLDAYWDKICRSDRLERIDFYKSNFSTLAMCDVFWTQDEKNQRRIQLLGWPYLEYLLYNNELIEFISKYKIVNNYINSLARTENREISRNIIRNIYSILADVQGEKENCFCSFAAGNKVQKILCDYKKSEKHPIERAVQVFLKLLSEEPFKSSNFSMSAFIFEFLLIQSGYPAIPDWVVIVKRWKSYVSTKNPKPIVELTVRLLKRKMREK